MTLKLDDSRCRIHSISDGPSGPGAPQGPHRNEEIVTNQRYVVMLWKMVTRYGTNVTLKEAAEEIKKHEEDRKLVSRFEAEHRDEIDEILGLIDYIDIGYAEEKFPRFTNLALSDWVYTSKINSFSKGIIAPVAEVMGPGLRRYPITNSIISKRPLKHIRAEILMRLNMLKRWGPS